MLPKSMMDCVREAVCDKGWPDHDARIVMKKELEEFNKKIYEPIIKPEIYITTVQYPDSFIETVYKRELGKITTDCKGCARLMTPNDPECKSCYKQSHYKARYTEVNIDVGFDVDIKKEMDWLNAQDAKQALNNVYGARANAKYVDYNKMFDSGFTTYVKADVESCKEMYKLLTESEVKDMNNGFKERAAQAVFFNKYLHRYEKIGIEKVIFNGPATIVFWNDHVKTVVKCQDEMFDPEKGLAMAITKRFFGNQGNYCEEFRKHMPGVINKKCKGCARLDKESDFKCRTCMYQDHYVTKEELEREEKKKGE